MLGVDEVVVGDVVDEAPVGLLRHVLVETPVAGLHVVDGNPHPLRHHRGKARVRVAEHEHGVRRIVADRLLRTRQHIAQHLSERVCTNVEQPVRRRSPRSRKKISPRRGS